MREVYVYAVHPSYKTVRGRGGIRRKRADCGVEYLVHAFGMKRLAASLRNGCDASQDVRIVFHRIIQKRCYGLIVQGVDLAIDLLYLMSLDSHNCLFHNRWYYRDYDIKIGRMLLLRLHYIEENY